MIDCPKFIEMQRMFHGKFVTIGKILFIAEIKIVITNVNVVDVNVITRIITNEEHVFKDREPRKTNNVIDWEKKKRLKKSMVETIQQIHKT
jgi:cell division protein FtsL